jgi:hypothetical protein
VCLVAMISILLFSSSSYNLSVEDSFVSISVFFVQNMASKFSGGLIMPFCVHMVLCLKT